MLDGNTSSVISSLQKKVGAPKLFHSVACEVGGWSLFVLTFDGMVNSELIVETMASLQHKGENRHFENATEVMSFLNDTCFLSTEKEICETEDECFSALISGNTVLLPRFSSVALKIETQNIPCRSISQPTANNNIKGSKEAFTESVKKNVIMVRRRLHTQNLQFREIEVGSFSKTKCVISYVEGRVSEKVLAEVEKRLQSPKVETVLETGTFEILFNGSFPHLFPSVDTTDRPDDVCRRLYEGRVAVFVDGTPFVLIVPFLMGDHFQTLDDYNNKALYTNIMRILRLVAFVIAVFSPALHIYFCSYAPDLLPPVMLKAFLGAEGNNPFPVAAEMLIVTLLYEIMKEAGLRLPKEVGHTVSIVGSIIIGETAINGKLLSPPVVLIAAIVSICAYLVPGLSDSVLILRLLCLGLTAFFGMYGILAVLLFTVITLLCKKSAGVPYLSSRLPVFKKTKQAFCSPDVPPLSEREDV